MLLRIKQLATVEQTLKGFVLKPFLELLEEGSSFNIFTKA
jgi:hypothetical protein